MSRCVSLSKSFLLVAALIFASLPVSASESGLRDWMRTARIAGAELHAAMTPEEIAARLDALAEQNVSVVQADSDFSLYLSENQFEAELAFIREFTAAAHARGLRTVWYYPLLEVLTENGKNRSRSMYKDHPDWVQRGLDGQPSVFYGDEADHPWLTQDMESAWMTLHSPYADYLLDRLTRLAGTGVDGLWLDAPLLSDVRSQWADTNPHAAARFKSDTGLVPPEEADWDDPVWRRWILWRYAETTAFLERIAGEVRKQAPHIAVIIGNITLDTPMATRRALDGATAKPAQGMIQAWDISPVSETGGMSGARPDDWIALIAMNKYANAAAGPEPAWVLTYGHDEAEAGLAMGVSLAAGNHPYETRVPSMTDTVGAAFRTRIFDWVGSHGAELFESRSAAPVGLLFSRPSLDFTDRGKGTGLYATWRSQEPGWWSTAEADSVYSQDYMAEYRGVAKWLSRSHVPFDIVVDPARDDLDRYQALIAPALNALSDAELQSLQHYVEQGGKLVVTGPSPFARDETGARRSGSPLVQFGLTRAAATSGAAAVGQGSLALIPEYIGKTYLDDGGAETAGDHAGEALLGDIEPPLRVAGGSTGESWVHVELRKRRQTRLLHLLNIPRRGVASLAPARPTIELPLPESSCEPRLSRTAPGEKEDNLAFDRTGDGIRFDVRVDAYALVRLRCSAETPPPLNHAPIARADTIATVIDRPLLIAPRTLTRNDGDLDGDPLRLELLEPEGGLKGRLEPAGEGDWLYTPPGKFVGSETLAYRVDDHRGGTDRAGLRINIEPETRVASAGKLKITIGTGDSGSLTSLTDADDKTLDIKPGPDGSLMVTDWLAHTPVDIPPHEVQELRFRYAGQFSHDGVMQTISVYNHQTQSWEAIDERELGTGDDTFIEATLSAPAAYISREGSISVRFRAHRHGSHFTQWANAMAWDIVKKH